MTSARVVGLCCLLVVTSCRDIDLPPPPSNPFAAVRGQVDTQGHLTVAGHDVALIAGSGSRVTTQTDAEGRFAFDGVAPGSYAVEVTVPGFAPPVLPPLTLSSGQTLDLGVLRPTWLGGTNAEAYLQGVVSVTGGGDAVGGRVRFLLEGPGEEIASAVISATGSFSARVPPGTYTLEATHPWYVSASQSGVVLASAQRLDLSATPLVMQVNPATLTGQVLAEVDQGTARPLSGATVTADTGLSAVTDVNGNFSLGGLPAGTRRFTVTRLGFHDALDARTAELQPAQTTTLPTVTLLLDRGTVVGEVSMADNVPIENVEVFIPGINGYAVTASQSALALDGGTPAASLGTFRLENVPVGTWEVRARRPSYAPAATANVVVTRGQVTSTGRLTLVRVLGDFELVDADPNNTPGFTRTPDVTLRLAAGTQAADYRVAESQANLGSAPWSAFTALDVPYTLLSTVDGPKTLFLQLRDAQQNVGPVLQASIVLDGTAPNLPPMPLAALVVDDGAGFTNKKAALPVALSALDVGSGVHHYLWSSQASDGGVLTGSASRAFQSSDILSLPAAPEGPLTLSVQFVDNAGNVSAPASATIVIDTIAPVGGMVSVRKGQLAAVNGYTRELGVFLDESFSSEPSGGQLSLQAAWSALDVPTSALQAAQSVTTAVLPSGPDGPRTLSYRFVDAAGNPGALASTSIELDTLAPTLTFSRTSASPTSSTLVNTVVSTTSTAEVQHASAVTLSEDPAFLGATPQALPSNGQLGLTLTAGDGTRRVYVRLRDRAGNDAVSSVTLVLDQTAPVVSTFSLLGTLADGAPSEATTSSATVKALFTQVGASHVALGDEGLTCASATWAMLPAGTASLDVMLSGTTAPRTVKACFRDEAGNIAGPFTDTIALDQSAPSSCTLTLTPYRADGTTSANGKTALRDVGVALSCPGETPTEWYLAESAVGSCATSLPYQPWPLPATRQLPAVDGTYTVRGCVRDAARNAVAITNQVTVTLDTVGPQGVSLVLDNGAAWVNGAQVTARGGRVASALGTATGATEWALAENATPSAFTAFTGPAQNFTFSATDGAKVLNAVFRDDVGHVSSLVSDTIGFDIQPPAVTGFTLDLVGVGVGFTNQRSVSATVTGSNDAVSMQTAEALNPTACADTDFALAATQPVSNLYPVLFSAGDGLKRACLRFADAAGNTSPIIADTITLDTVPPSGPYLVTPDQVLPVADNGVVSIRIATPSTDTNFSTYELIGGKLAAWTPVTATGMPAVNFSVALANDGSETGQLNIIRLRAVDLAGNRSPDTSTNLTADTNAPEPLATNPMWVDNGRNRAVVYWGDSSSADVARITLEYGAFPSSGTLFGAFATEGNSPFQIAAGSYYGLSGLPNGVPTYARFSPVDRAGNAGPWLADAGVTPLLLQPNEVSPNLIGSLSLGATTRVHRMANQGSALYVVGTAACSSTVSSPTYLHVVDLAHLPGPLQGGRLVTPSVTPSLVRTLTFSDGVLCNYPQAPYEVQEDFRSSPLDLVVDGNYLFLPSGPKVHIFDLSQPLNPVEVATASLDTLVDSGFRATGVQLVGDRLVVYGRDLTASSPGFIVTVLSLGLLYDANAATRTFAAGDVLGTYASGGPGYTVLNSGVVSHSRLLLTLSDSPTNSSVEAIDLTNALDGSAATLFPPVPRPSSFHHHAGVNASNRSHTRPEMSGNLMLTAPSDNGLSALNIATLWGATLTTPLPRPFETAVLGADQFAVVGGEVYLPEKSTGALRAADLSAALANAVTPTSQYSLSAAPGSVLVWGNAAVVSVGGTLRFFELATPRALSLRVSTGQVGYHQALRSGFLFTSGSGVKDLFGGQTPSTLGVPNVEACTNTAVWMDEVELSANWNQVRARSLEHLSDRTGSTGSGGWNASLLTVGTEWFLDLATHGNWLVGLVMRADGVYLDTWQARKVRNRAVGVLHSSNAITLADRVSSVRVSTLTGSAVEGELAITAGRAVVTLDPGGTSPGPYLLFADMTAAFDDTSSTFGPGNVFGPYTVPPAREAVLQGNTAYVATVRGLVVVNVTALMDEAPGTLPTPPAQPTSAATLTAFDFDGLFVSGSMLLAAPGGEGIAGNGVVAVDVSNPTAPEPRGLFPAQPQVMTCPVGPDLRRMRNRITAAGSRAYFLSNGSLRVLELE